MSPLTNDIATACFEHIAVHVVPVVRSRFGISLVAVLDITRADPQLQLNPGSDYIMKSSDYCFYMGVTREEYSKVSDLAQNRTFIPSAARTRNIGRDCLVK